MVGSWLQGSQIMITSWTLQGEQGLGGPELTSIGRSVEPGIRIVLTLQIFPRDANLNLHESPRDWNQGQLLPEWPTCFNNIFRKGFVWWSFIAATLFLIKFSQDFQLLNWRLRWFWLTTWYNWWLTWFVLHVVLIYSSQFLQMALFPWNDLKFCKRNFSNRNQVQSTYQFVIFTSFWMFALVYFEKTIVGEYRRYEASFWFNTNGFIFQWTRRPAVFSSG